MVVLHSYSGALRDAKKPISIVLLLLTVSLVVGLWVTENRPIHAWSKADAQMSVAARLPLGSSTRQVESWLREHHTSHSLIAGAQMADYALFLNSENAVGGKDYKPSDIGYLVIATQTDVRRGFMARYDMTFLFYFDRRGRLVQYLITEQPVDMVP